MRSFLLYVLLIVPAISFSQITITTNHLPDAGDTLITRNAIFTDGVDLDATGENYVWNFTTEDLQPLMLSPGTICYDVDNTPLAYQFMFNNPFDEAHNSDFAIGVQQAGFAGVSFDNSFMYYKNSASKYTITGMGSSINGLPLAAKMNAPDLLYKLPLNYGMADSSHSVMNFEVPQFGYYGLDQHRNFECDGWGTLNIWGESFEVLRVRSVVNATDSLFTSLISLGFKFPRPETVTYEWLSHEFKVPVLKITTTAGIVSQVQVADFYTPPATLVEEIESEEIAVFPNPVNQYLNIKLPEVSDASVRVFDSSGRLLLSETYNYSATIQLNVEQLSEGAYTLLVSQSGKQFSKTFLKQ